MKILFKKVFLISLFIGALLICCGEDQEDYDDCDIDCPSKMRTGALCNDGTSSDAMGSGACSSHGGVACWYCD